MENQEIFVPLEENFDWNQIIVDDPQTHKFTKDKYIIQWTTSDVYVQGKNNSKHPTHLL